MPLNPSRVFESRQAAQYTGQNSADFNNEISDFSIVSENAQGLTFTSGGQERFVAPNGYIAWYQGEVTDVFQNENDYREVYADLSAEIALNHVHTLTTSTGQAVQA